MFKMWGRTVIERIDVLELEGLAINGMIKSFKLIDCEKKGKIRLSKITALLADGREVETDCMEYPRIVRVFVLLEKYKNWGDTLVMKDVSEEMMKGITYDLDHEAGQG